MQPNKIRPTNRLEAIKWNYYNSDSWDFIKIRYWPWDIAKAVISKNLNYVMRFRWYLYLVGNGMDPAMARDVVKHELSHSKDKQMHIVLTDILSSYIGISRFARKEEFRRNSMSFFE